MKTRIIKILFISLLFSAKIAPAAEMEERQNTPLINAIQQNKSLKDIKSLVESKANVNAKTGSGNITPLMYASACKRLDVVNFLLEEDANVNDTTNCGHTAWCVAKNIANPEIMAVLEKNGAKNPHHFFFFKPAFLLLIPVLFSFSE